MGCPSVYYKRALQYFSYCLAFEDDNLQLAIQLQNEESEKRLEEFILSKKNNFDDRLFFYNAGLTCQGVFNDAYKEGCDAVNACCGGIAEFEDLIGLSRESEYE